MCGIAGIYNRNGDPVNVAVLERMSNRIAHRGPDDSGIVLLSDKSGQREPLVFDSCPRKESNSDLFENYNIGLAHRRLSIIDLSKNGHQPMCNEDGTIWIIYNGEIYNHLSIKEELDLDRHTFQSRTDTEVILHAYEQWGIECVERFNGMFAFALWDGRKNTLFLVRDRIGVKPLYYIEVNKNIFFASEIKALLEIPEYRKKLNTGILSEYLTFLTVAPPNTIFEGINKLPPASWISFNAFAHYQLQHYWKGIHQTTKKDMRFEDAIVETENRLKESIKLRMMSDVPFGVFLSGGVDSSLNVALMSQVSNLPINTLTVGYDLPDMSQNEYRFARQIAEQYRTNHQEIVLSMSDFLSAIPKVVYHQDEPIADPVCVPLYYLAQKAREKGIIVLQIGEGADEIFAGYSNIKIYKLLYNWFWHNLKYYPDLMKKLIFYMGTTVLRDTKYRKYLDYFSFMEKNEPLFRGFHIEFYPRELYSLLVNKELSGDPFRYVKNTIEDFGALDRNNFLSMLAFAEIQLRLPELLMMRVDKMTMANSIEGRVPYLDYTLVEFMLSVPDEIKMKHNETKYLLKKIVEKYLPRDLVYRRKMGFGVPMNIWFQQGLGKYFKKVIFNSELREQNIINYDFVEQMFNLTSNGKVNYYGHLWCLTNLSLWYDYWICNKKLETT